ncbi:MAG: methylmalonyl-CoA epimerase [Holophagales bacterium]|jgi:methylmalonyl-CoA/ethylmalonyl-CoA epimerase|nr:methylmalonyl-CoA epimerase [Holophagales bacterium]
MKLLKISHIGIASPTLQEAMERLERIFGIKHEHTEEVADQKVRTAFYPIGESTLEYLESTDPESAIGKFLEKKGPGIHHLAFEVDDVDAAVRELLDKGVQMIDKTPRSGAHGNRIAFIHPKETGGVLIEICQPSSGH